MPQFVYRGLEARLDQVLEQWLREELHAEPSRAQIRKILMKGEVYLDGRVSKVPSRAVKKNSKIEFSDKVLLDLKKSDKNQNQSTTSLSNDWQVSSADILFEDEDLIAIHKPLGLPTQPTLDPQRPNLFDRVKQFLLTRDGSEYLGLHHRLDRDTTGILLFTKTRRVNRAIATQFSGHLIRKTYQVITYRDASAPVVHIGQTWTVQNHLSRDKKRYAHLRPRTHVFTAAGKGGLKAETKFRIKAINQKSGAFWIEAQPLTGRTHQIRVHLAEAGMPVMGDRVYAGIRGIAVDREQQMFLHAEKLELEHPISKKTLSLHCPLPPHFVKQLKSLKLKE